MHSFSSRFLIVFLLLIISVPVYASSSIYGRLDLAVSSDNKANGTITDVRSHASRVGIKGNQIFDNGMAVIYQYEWQVDPVDGDPTFSQRNSYLGLRKDITPQKFADFSLNAFNKGAKFLKGCCNIMPDHIRALSNSI